MLDPLVEFARQAGAVIVPPDCATLLVDEQQGPDLPEDLREDPTVVVSSGSDVIAVLSD